MLTHNSRDSGDMNENNPGGSFLGFAYKMLMPNVMNGIVKSTAVLRSYVIVRSHMAKSAFCKFREKTKKLNFCGEN